MRNRAKRERDHRARYALTFGLEADGVRAAHCIAERETTEADGRCRCVCRTKLVDFELMTVRDPAHIISVGAGGGRFDLVSLCSAHHGQQHQMGIDSFAALYGLDLRALADEQALAHEAPLGIQGLASRWAWWHTVVDVRAEYVNAPGPDLEGYDLAALLAWTRRRMARTYSESSLLREDMACDVVYDLLGLEQDRWSDALWALCAAAGWPS